MFRNAIALTALALALAGCAVGPNYARPTAAAPPQFKEAAGWKQAEPSDAVSREDWWTVFNDPVLNGLEARVAVDNQTLRAAEAAYRQARGLLDQQRATLFPTVNLTGAASRATYATGAGLGGVPAGVVLPTAPLNTYSAALGATWDVDVWGRIRRTVEGARATAQASAADLANARLSAQVLLAADYFQLREADEEKRLVDGTVKAYADNLRIVQGRYSSGVAARGDLLTAQTQLKTAQAGAEDLLRTRAQLEHAIAVLAGQAPADLTIAPMPWALNVPAVPAAMPASLLERRPDIARAERRVQAANAQIGVQTAGYFPDLSLSGQYGFNAETLQRLFSATTNSWSIGANAAQTVFDAGATSAKVRQARAGYDAAVATYRQTVLTAFQQVEDNIAALRILEAEYDLDLASSQSADEAESLATKQYKAGQVDYTTVVVAQNIALNARRTVAQSARDRMVASVDLISALGGGWSQQQLARK